MKRSALDCSQITAYLFVGKTPAARQYAELADAGVRLIINMRAEAYAFPTEARRAIQTIWVPSLDNRFTPIKLRKIIEAAEQADAVIKGGGKVYVYCRAGRHRSVAMAAAILISQGYDIRSAVNLIKSKRLVADPEKAHIYKVIAKFSQAWNAA
jgi:dual specificity MAP kinase phosphatase